MAQLKRRLHLTELKNQQYTRRRLPWVLGGLVILIIVALGVAAILIVKTQGITQGTGLLTIISIVFTFAIGLLGLFLTWYIWYASRVQKSNGTTLQSEPEPISDNSFEWISIPEGRVTLEDKRTFDEGTKGGTYKIPLFEIAKYPVTNAQYEKFVDAPNGYSDLHWWNFSDEAKKWRENHPQPKGPSFERNDIPRTNVCWFDAVAFCRWISGRIGQKITLPTEQQWQRAAQDDHRAYPWGDMFDQKQCNSSVKEKSTGPTPVTQYPNGANAYQVMDLCGNVWEWCLTEWGTDRIGLTGSKARVVRGGSWKDTSRNILLVIYRAKRDPDCERDNVGFRCVRIG